jgi:hypothetical protein
LKIDNLKNGKARNLVKNLFRRRRERELVQVAKSIEVIKPEVKNILIID